MKKKTISLALFFNLNYKLKLNTKTPFHIKKKIKNVLLKCT